MSDTIVHDTANAILHRLRARLSRGLEPYEAPLTDAVHGFLARRFDTQGAVGGNGPWPELSAATIHRHGPHPVLEDRGSLWASLTETEATGGYAVLSADRMTLTVGSQDPVLKWTEHGTRHMPARPVTPAELPADEWAELIADRLLAGL